MAALNDYVCMAHGVFESRTGKCPHGCGKGMTQIVHLKAPGFVTARTQGIDSTLRGLAADHGLTDMNNHGGETGAFVPDAGVARQNAEMQRQLQTGSTFAGAIGQNGIAKTLSQSGFQSDNALNNDVVKSMIQPPKPNVVASWSEKK